MSATVRPDVAADAALPPPEPSGVIYGCGCGPAVNGMLVVPAKALDSDGDCRHFARVMMPAGSPKFVQIAGESSIAVARDVNGGVWVWGRGAGVARPTLVTALSNCGDGRASRRCVSVAAAASFAVAVLDDGSVVCIGDKGPGGEIASRRAPRDRHTSPLDKATTTAGGAGAGAGQPRLTQLAFKTDAGDSEDPRAVGADASDTTVLVLAADGGLWACGGTITCGLGRRARRQDVLQRIVDSGGKPMCNVVSYSVGSLHAAAVLADETVWVWGNGVSGNHGLGVRVNIVEKPTKVPCFGHDEGCTAAAANVACTKGSPNPKQIRTKDGWLAGQEGPRTHVVDADGGLWIAGTSHKGLAADHLYKTLSPAIDHLGFHRVGGPAVIDKGAPRVYIGAAEMLRTDPDTAARRMGMASPDDFGHGPDRTTGYLSAVRVAQSAPSHIHSMALSHDGRLFTWGCGSNGRCGLDAIVQIQGGKKRTMKCYVHSPSEVESLEGKRVVSAAVGKWWTWAIVDE